MEYGQQATANQNQYVVTGSTTQGGVPVDYGQQATVNPVNFMVYSEDALEWQPFQFAEVTSHGSINIEFSNGRWLTVPGTSIRPIDQTQLGKEWNENIFGSRWTSAHVPRPPAPVGLTGEEFRGLTEVLRTAQSPEELLRSVRRMSITVQKAFEKTFMLSLVDSHRATSRVTELGIPSMLQLLLRMQAEDSILLQASPTVRLNKVQRTGQYTPMNTTGGARCTLWSSNAAGAGGGAPHVTVPSPWGLPAMGPPPAYTSAPLLATNGTAQQTLWAGGWGTPAGWQTPGFVGGVGLFPPPG